MMSGVSDKSIVLRNNGLWAGNTSQVNLDKLREETRLSRDEYFRLKSSRCFFLWQFDIYFNEKSNIKLR